MFSDSKRLFLAVVLLLAIAQASMETGSDIKLQKVMDVHRRRMQGGPKLGAPAPPTGAPAPPVGAPAPPKGAPAPPKGAPSPPIVVPAPPKGAPAPPVDCKAGCGERCKLHGRPNVCLRACGTCCAKCKCVPPGHSGNREVCGSCYTDWKTHNNQTKCP